MSHYVRPSLLIYTGNSRKMDIFKFIINLSFNIRIWHIFIYLFNLVSFEVSKDTNSTGSWSIKFRHFRSSSEVIWKIEIFKILCFTRNYTILYWAYQGVLETVYPKGRRSMDFRLIFRFVINLLSYIVSKSKWF